MKKIKQYLLEDESLTLSKVLRSTLSKALDKSMKINICSPQMLHGFGPIAAVLHDQFNYLVGNQTELVKGVSDQINDYTIDCTLCAQASW